MTEEEKKIARDLKARIVMELEGMRPTILDRYGYALTDTDGRIAEYVCGVIDSPEKHNLYEILSVRRFIQMLDKYQWKPKG